MPRQSQAGAASVFFAKRLQPSLAWRAAVVAGSSCFAYATNRSLLGHTRQASPAGAVCRASSSLRRAGTRGGVEARGVAAAGPAAHALLPSSRTVGGPPMVVARLRGRVAIARRVMIDAASGSWRVLAESSVLSQTVAGARCSNRGCRAGRGWSEPGGAAGTNGTGARFTSSTQSFTASPLPAVPGELVGGDASRRR
jgi:hypothetical protein